ncbi:MarR family winged helix-turn-helix transcriptional regulator [Rhodospirillum rubrum]|uniref:MarR family winged helix-turn-helix transcriptional regulator n=1 Tax=Rhodospirillum rubrum TaxID=1085 RepID=UPI0028B0FFA4|nr:MarR family transcriptional regulator [Rhodospirillum rubrum]
MLVRIASGVDTSAAELCRTIGYDSGSMTRMLDRLEKRGLIYRRRSIEDRRVVRLSLTDLGKELYPQLTPIAIETLNHVLKGFTPEEADILMGLLDRILANANTA